MTRLIDADALLEVLNSKQIINLRHVIDIITNAPTIQREGWVSVPIEPTEEMKLAVETPAKYLFEVAAGYENVGIPVETCIEIYKAMIQAAPTDTE